MTAIDYAVNLVLSGILIVGAYQFYFFTQRLCFGVALLGGLIHLPDQTDQCLHELVVASLSHLLFTDKFLCSLSLAFSLKNLNSFGFG